MLKTTSEFQGVLKMFMLGMLKTVLKTVLKYEKTTITLYGACWNQVAEVRKLGGRQQDLTPNLHA